MNKDEKKALKSQCAGRADEWSVHTKYNFAEVEEIKS